MMFRLFLFDYCLCIETINRVGFVCYCVSGDILWVSRFFVGIIFYLREVLLTSHYEKRLFEHASQPRVADSDIRLLSHLWS